MIVNSWSAGKKAMAGYGMAMLMVFLATTVMVGASMQMMAAPITMAYLGAASQDNLAAQQLAQAGMDVIQADLQTKFDTGVAITTGYSYPLTSMSMPDSPDALGGATSTVGSYSGAIGAINGNTALVKVTATVGVGTYTYNKLIALSRSIYPLDNVTGATAAYGLRLLRSAHLSSGSPYAIRVRRASDDSEQDIGFTATGAIDTPALLTFLNGGVTTYPKPLDSVGSAAAAYSLRKLRTAYTGSAIRVRRSSDNAELDIGFTSSGDLDVSALVDFVGTGSGYVKTWYDQSGNSRNQSQTSTGSQPVIVNNGVLVTVNGRLSMLFDGTDDYFSGSFDISNNFSILTVARTNVTHGLDSKSTSGTSGTGGQKYLIWPISSRTPDSEAGISLGTNGAAVYEHSGGYMPPLSTAPLALGSNLLITTAVYTNKQPFLYLNSQLSDVGYVSPKPNVYAGDNIGGIGAAYGFHSGEVSEVIYYPSSLSTANRRLLENDEALYYKMPLADLGYRLPGDAIPGASVAYGLRKLTSAGVNAIRVRRSSDNAEQNFGFDSAGNLNTASLMNFVGSGSGYVTTWYDQVTPNDNPDLGYNARQTNTAKQPRIVNAGVLETRNGRPVIHFVSNANSLLLNTAVAITNQYTAFGVAQKAVAGDDFFVMGGSSQNYQILRLNGLNQLHAYAQPGPFATHDLYTSVTFDFVSNMNVVAITREADSSFTGDFNGTYGYVLANSGGGTTSNINPTEFGRIGGFYTFEGATGWIAESILYTSTLSQTQRELVESSEQAYYTASNNSGLGTGYIVTWYDQSGNGRNLTQSTKIAQPRLQWKASGGVRSLYFDTQQYLANNSFTGVVTGANVTAMMVGATSASGKGNWDARIVNLYKSTDFDDYAVASSMCLFSNSSWTSITSALNGVYPYGVVTQGSMFQSSVYHDSTNAFRFYVNGSQTAATTTTANLQPDALFLGNGFTNAIWWGRPFNGEVAEFILYNSALTDNQRQIIEQGERTFYATP